jgi:hypothetical protein
MSSPIVVTPVKKEAEMRRWFPGSLRYPSGKMRSRFTNRSIIVWTLRAKPFVLSLSKHERLSDAPFDEHVLSEPFVLRQAFD